MNSKLKAGIALAALSGVFALAGAAAAADLGGSLKDGYIAPMPQISRGVSGPCYVRADVGYSVSSDPDIKWAQTDPDPASPTFQNYLGSNVETLNYENSWFGEVGAGCGSGSRGIRAELMLGYHGSRKIDGEPEFPWYSPPSGGPPEDDPLHTDITSYTAMFNAYKDFGTFRGFTPYIGAGVGLAYNITDEVYFTENPALLNRIRGDRDVSLAWALMAGVGYQLTDRTILDVGYRYLDLGKAGSQNIDNINAYNPRVNIDDLASHEVKVGLRYQFGHSDCCGEYVPVK